jgi:hypothetical protein
MKLFKRKRRYKIGVNWVVKGMKIISDIMCEASEESQILMCFCSMK